MTLYDVELAHGYWKRNPPLRILVMMVAKALGIEFKEPEEEKKKYFTPQEAMALMRITGGKIPGLGQVGAPPGV